LVILGYHLICIGDILFSEAQFKTLKYRSDFPQRFGCIEDARAHCQAFFAWYNTEHRHCGIAFMVPEDVHYGRTEQRSSRPAPLPSMPPSRPTRSASKANVRPLNSRLRRPGSIRQQHPRTTTTSLSSNTNFPGLLSQMH
jgi:hypothetical protein